MKQWLKPIILFLMIVGMVGAIVQISGIINIGASSKHWAITEWFLSFSMKRSVKTYSLSVPEVPDLSQRALIVEGAGHYEMGCRQCHGGPDEPSYLGQITTPEAPFLPPEIDNWNDKELFRIVKHGVKFTSMPAWPTQTRDDEVWAMVAFLRKLPHISRDEYKELVYGRKMPLMIMPSHYSGEVSGHVAITCSHCHGVDGNGRGEGVFPGLAGQKQEYLVNSLRAYKQGKRNSGTMELVSSSLEEEMIIELSRYYSSQKRKVLKKAYSPEEKIAIERGREIAHKGIPEQHVAACIGCHGPNQKKQDRKNYLPVLYSQPATYLETQLKLFVENKRGGSKHAVLMQKAVWKLSDQQRKDLSLYYESLPPSSDQ